MAGVPGHATQGLRIVTAVVMNAGGSAQLADALDPEDAHDVFVGAREVMIKEVADLGGIVQELTSEGILAVFGAPVAHEDDAVRGVLCGLRVADAIADYASSHARGEIAHLLSVRVGVESGRVVTGPMGAGSRVEYGASGDALATATRLQNLAMPDTVLVGPTTRAMAGEAFMWAEEDRYAIQGRTAQIVAATALAFTPQRPPDWSAPVVPLIGREAELVRAEEVIQRLGNGDGSVMVVVGAVGTGKSRLVDELHALLPGEQPDAWLEATAASHSQSIPFAVYRSMYLRMADLTEGASLGELGQAMAAMAEASSPASASAIRALIAAIGRGAWPAAASGDPPALARERLFEAICAHVESLTREHPTVIVLEDLHWMDPTSVALTRALAERCSACALLIVITTRPEADALASVDALCEGLHQPVARIELRPLDRDDLRTLLHARLPGGLIPRRLEDQLLDTTDGNPYFLLEQIRALLDGGALTESLEGVHFVEGSSVHLATTIEQALMARIDRLESADRRTLLAASVLGARFDASVVDRVAGIGADGSLARLVRAELLVDLDSTDRAHPWLRFQHPLLRQVAYGSLLKRERRELHGRAADVMEEQLEGRTGEFAASIGHHLAEAGDVDRALPYLLRAARSAAATFSNEEAADLAAEGLDLIVTDDRRDLRGVTLDLLRVHVAATRNMARYDTSIASQRRLISLVAPSPPLEKAAESCLLGELLVDNHQYEEALTVLDTAAKGMGENPWIGDGFDVWLSINLTRADVFYWLADDDRLAAVLERVGPVVEQRATPKQRLAFLRMVRSAAMRRDRFVISDEVLRIDEEIYLAEVDDIDDRTRAWAPFRRGFTLMWHGDLDVADQLFRVSLGEADRIGSAMLRARSLAYSMVTARLRGDVAGAAELLDPVRESAREAGLMEYVAMAAATASWIAYRRSDTSGVLAEGHQALALWSAMSTRYQFDWMCSLPLMAVAVEARDLPRAEHWAQSMLAAEQQPLHHQVSDHLRAGLRTSRVLEDAAWTEFTAALAAAREHGYL